MNKKMTFGKILGIIFCILAAAGTVVLLFANAYFGGQMKVIDKYYTAIERDDFEGYKACLAYPEIYTEEDFAWQKKMISILQDNENIHSKVKLIKRQRQSKSYVLTLSLTIYNDSEHAKCENVMVMLCRKNGKWFMW